MLSRVADALYWMGRYVERAENVSRLLLVTSEVSVEMEGLDDALAQGEWDTLVAALPGASDTELDYSPSGGLSIPYLKAFLLETDNPVSVLHSLGRARDNARHVREALTKEVFSNLNEAWRELEGHRRKRIRDPAVGHDVVERTHQSILTTLGAIEHTLTRDQGWTFLKLGEAIERTQRTLLVLRARIPGLRQGPGELDAPLFYARWRSLLRSLASLENFRQVHGAGLDPTAVTRFLLFDPSAPRSAHCGIARMQRYLETLPREGGEFGPAARILGRLLAVVTYEEERIMSDPDALSFPQDTIDELNRAHEAICRQYFPG